MPRQASLHREGFLTNLSIAPERRGPTAPSSIIPQGRGPLAHPSIAPQGRGPIAPSSITPQGRASTHPNTTPQGKGLLAHASITPQGRGPLAHPSITPQGRGPLAQPQHHPTRKRSPCPPQPCPIASAAARGWWGAMSCQGSSALPTTPQGSHHIGGHRAPQEHMAGPCGCPQPTLQQAGLGAGIPTAQPGSGSRAGGGQHRSTPSCQRRHEFHGLSPAQAEGTCIPL